MKESVLEFGPGNRLVGILCRPDEGGAPARVCLVLTNSGIIHRVGANRLHVRLARRMAAAGIPSLRYDLPGIGDSEVSGRGGDLVQEQLAGTIAAVHALRRLGVAEHFVMFGLCSGAGHSLAAAGAEPAISGAVIIDPPVMVATRRHRLNQLFDAVRRGLRPRVWWRFLRGRYAIWKMLRDRSVEPPRPGRPVSLPNSPKEGSRRQASILLRTLVERRVRLWMVITGHNRDIYSYRDQLFDSFPEIAGLRGLTQIDLRPSAGHTFGREGDRQFLESRLIRWLGTTDFV